MEIKYKTRIKNTFTTTVILHESWRENLSLIGGGKLGAGIRMVIESCIKDIEKKANEIRKIEANSPKLKKKKKE